MRLMGLEAGESQHQPQGFWSHTGYDQTGWAPHTHTGYQSARPSSVHTRSLCGHPSATPWDLGVLTWVAGFSWEDGPQMDFEKGPSSLGSGQRRLEEGTLGFWLSNCAQDGHELPEAWPLAWVGSSPTGRDMLCHPMPWSQCLLGRHDPSSTVFTHDSRTRLCDSELFV